MIRRALLALAVAAGLAAPAPATAQEQCRLALLLGLDVSASVDAEEYAQQIQGLAAALIDPNVVEAALSGNGPVALSIYEWSGRFQQDILVDWTMIRSEADLTTVAERVLRATRAHEDFPTALGYALGFAASHFAEAPPCLFQTLDISGDGQNNDGFPPEAAYAHFPLAGVTVNGLAIGGASREIEQYYLDEVIQGPGAFVEFARSHDEFAEAMRRKLERELRVVILGQLDRD
ncbi:hypothetical protein roselon_00256 [Roseibacterium elongatum DSM 19469]|uniref:von Willebrand factor type A domain protein n=1 Tax=Roseicyclus elongatus DSM 19469 TaxID=1294273 RepID=W8S1U8_9RHOB|nr:DUF1194 domain-containing protein [Roseibacterium elongatum]AHM02711.1 hypothetical protein roselon_00256 [Roseibacterium elongatum DSM 19469]